MSVLLLYDYGVLSLCLSYYVFVKGVFCVFLILCCLFSWCWWFVWVIVVSSGMCCIHTVFVVSIWTLLFLNNLFGLVPNYFIGMRF